MNKDNNKELKEPETMPFAFRWIDNMEDVTDAEFREMILAIVSYRRHGTKPNFTGFKLVAWREIQDRINYDRQKYDAICQRNQQNGLNGGRPAKPKNPNGFSRNPTKPKKAEGDGDGDIKESTLSCTKETAEPFSLTNETDSIPKTSFKQWTLKDFQDNVSKYTEFSDIAEAFIFYWTEPTPRGKMRFQLGKTWETGRRLKRWADNKKSAPSQTQTANEVSTPNIKEMF